MNFAIEKRIQSAIIYLIRLEAGDKLKLNIICALITGVVGVGIAFLNYLFSKRVLLKAPEKYSITTVLRQVIQVGFLVIIYFVFTKFFQQIDFIYPVVGAVAGMTIPMFIFTKKLITLNEQTTLKLKDEEADKNG